MSCGVLIFAVFHPIGDVEQGLGISLRLTFVVSASSSSIQFICLETGVRSLTLGPCRSCDSTLSRNATYMQSVTKTSNELVEAVVRSLIISLGHQFHFPITLPS